MKIIKLHYVLFVLICSFCLSSCKKDGDIPYIPTASDISFTVVGDRDLEQTIYPSLLIGLSNAMSKSNTDFL